MYRTILEELEKWKNSTHRKPLIIRGARQVGKSWVVEKFGTENYPGAVHIINFEKRSDIHQIFNLNFDISRILNELQFLLELKIEKHTDLIFFDEIQACPKALMSLRYFYEDQNDYHIIAAGSLLDFALKDVSYPVGRVTQLEMYPMTFYEFLFAANKENIVQLISETPKALSESIQLNINEWLSKYMIIGGMPACVKRYLETISLQEVALIQDDLIYFLKEDFKKYSPIVNPDCLNDILINVAANVGSQLKYTKLSENFSGVTIKKGFDVLKTARWFHQVSNVSIAGLPLIPSGIQFKAVFIDIGLMIRMSGLNVKEHLINDRLIASFKGMLAEQLVGQELLAIKTGKLYCWINTDKGAVSEVDYVIENNGEIIPIEVKYGKSGSLKSLHLLLAKYAHLTKAIVVNNSTYGQEDKIIFSPLYYLNKILEI